MLSDLIGHGICLHEKTGHVQMDVFTIYFTSNVELIQMAFTMIQKDVIIMVFI